MLILYFGSRKLSSVIGLLFTANSIGYLVGPAVSGVLIDSTGNYIAAAEIIGVFFVASLGALFLVERRKEDMLHLHHFQKGHHSQHKHEK